MSSNAEKPMVDRSMMDRFWVYNKKEQVVISKCSSEWKARQKAGLYAHADTENDFLVLEVIAIASEPSKVEWTELRPKPLPDSPDSSVRMFSQANVNQAEAEAPERLRK